MRRLRGRARLALAGMGVRTLVVFGPQSLPRLQQVHIDLFVLASTMGASLLPGVLFGLAPALRLSRLARRSFAGASSTGARHRAPARLAGGRRIRALGDASQRGEPARGQNPARAGGRLRAYARSRAMLRVDEPGTVSAVLRLINR